MSTNTADIRNEVAGRASPLPWRVSVLLNTSSMILTEGIGVFYSPYKSDHSGPQNSDTHVNSYYKYVNVDMKTPSSSNASSPCSLSSTSSDSVSRRDISPRLRISLSPSWCIRKALFEHVVVLPCGDRWRQLGPGHLDLRDCCITLLH